MQCLSRYVGNIHRDPELHERVATWQRNGTLDDAIVDERDTHKGRLRIFTEKGQEYGLLLARGTVLAAGDVFLLEEGDGAVLISLTPQELMVLTLRDDLSRAERLRWAVRIGHVLGNQHWPVAVVGEQLLTPVTIDRAVMETVLKTHHVTDYCTIHYEQRPWPTEEESGGWTTHH